MPLHLTVQLKFGCIATKRNYLIALRLFIHDIVHFLISL